MSDVWDNDRLIKLLGPESAKIAIDQMKALEAVYDAPEDRYPPTVTIDRARFERLIKAASSWASELEYPGDEPGGAIKWAGLEPGDLDPIP